MAIIEQIFVDFAKKIEGSVWPANFLGVMQKSLKAFIEVARQKSFSLAADNLYISQSATSKRISGLELELGAKLFDRIGKKVELTEAGRNLMQPAQALIRNIENMKQVVAALSKTVSGSLIMATSHHIGLHRLSPVLGKFSKTYPEVKLDIRFMDSEDACTLVEQGEIELAIVTLPENPGKVLKLKTLWIDNLQPVADLQHPLAAANKINLSDLLQYPAVLPARETFTRKILEKVLGKSKLKINMATNYLETLKMLTLAGLGWSILPDTMLDDKLKVLGINLNLKRKLGAVIHKDKTLSNTAKAMLDLAGKNILNSSIVLILIRT